MPFNKTITPSYSCSFDQGTRLRISTAIKRHPFSGLMHSAGQLLHTAYRIPTSRDTSQLSLCINSFPFLFSFLWLFSFASAFSRFAIPAYQKWPTRPPLKIPGSLPLRQRFPRSGSEFVNRLRLFRPSSSNHLLYPNLLPSAPCYP